MLAYNLVFHIFVADTIGISPYLNHYKYAVYLINILTWKFNAGYSQLLLKQICIFRCPLFCILYFIVFLLNSNLQFIIIVKVIKKYQSTKLQHSQAASYMYENNFISYFGRKVASNLILYTYFIAIINRKCW